MNYIYPKLDTSTGGLYITNDNYIRNVINTPYTVNSNTVAYYRFDGNILDESGNNYSGVTTNSGYQFDKYYKCLDMWSGSSSQVDFSNPVIPNPPVTISFWSKIQSPSNSGNTFLSNTGIYTGSVDNTGVTIYNVYWVGWGYLMCEWNNKGGNDVSVHTNMNVCDGLWHNIIYTWDGTIGSGKAKCYVDGVLKNSPYSSYTADCNGGTNLRLGYCYGWYFNKDVQLEELIVEKVSWNQTNVTNYYNNCLK